MLQLIEELRGILRNPAARGLPAPSPWEAATQASSAAKNFVLTEEDSLGDQAVTPGAKRGRGCGADGEERSDIQEGAAARDAFCLESPGEAASVSAKPFRVKRRAALKL